MRIASQARTATEARLRASDRRGKRLVRFRVIVPGIEISPTLPGKFRDELVNSPLNRLSSNGIGRKEGCSISRKQS
jgi:hypothetical protein